MERGLRYRRRVTRDGMEEELTIAERGLLLPELAVRERPLLPPPGITFGEGFYYGFLGTAGFLVVGAFLLWAVLS